MRLHDDCQHRQKSEERGRTITRLRRDNQVWETAYRDLWRQHTELLRAVQAAGQAQPATPPWTIATRLREATS